MKGRLLPWSTAPAAENMAMDEALFFSYLYRDAPSTLRFYGWCPPAVSIGYFQDYRRAVDPAACRKRGVDWVRRPTGGRSVFHEDEITYCLVAGEREGFTGKVAADYLRIAAGFQDGFARLGVKVDLAPAVRPSKRPAIRMDPLAGSAACFTSVSRYELTAGGKKLVGSAQRRISSGFLQHGSILLRFHAEHLTAVLGKKADPRQVDLLRQSVTSLEEIMGYRPEEQVVIKALVSGLSRVLGIMWEPGELTPGEKELARRLQTSKYMNAGWNKRHFGNREPEAGIRMKE